MRAHREAGGAQPLQDISNSAAAAAILNSIIPRCCPSPPLPIVDTQCSEVSDHTKGISTSSAEQGWHDELLLISDSRSLTSLRAWASCQLRKRVVCHFKSGACRSMGAQDGLDRSPTEAAVHGSQESRGSRAPLQPRPDNAPRCFPAVFPASSESPAAALTLQTGTPQGPPPPPLLLQQQPSATAPAAAVSGRTISTGAAAPRASPTIHRPGPVVSGVSPAATLMLPHSHTPQPPALLQVVQLPSLSGTGDDPNAALRFAPLHPQQQQRLPLQPIALSGAAMPPVFTGLSRAGPELLPILPLDVAHRAAPRMPPNKSWLLQVRAMLLHAWLDSSACCALWAVLLDYDYARPSHERVLDQLFHS